MMLILLSILFLLSLSGHLVSFECVFKTKISLIFVKLQVLGLRLGVDFTFTLGNNDNHNDNDNNDNNDNNPHLNFFKGTVLGVKEQGLGIRDKVKEQY